MPYSSIKWESPIPKDFEDEWEFDSINKKFKFDDEWKDTISGIEPIKSKWNFSEETLGWLL